MEEVLRSIYYDPKHPGAFSSAYNLYRYAKEIDKSITLSEVKTWLKGELTYTLHKQARKNFARNPIIVSRIDEQWEADIVDMQEFRYKNRGYKYILTIIDCFSKYAFAVPLKNKSGKTVAEALEKIFKYRYPQSLRTDRGKEFLNSSVQNLLKDLQINYFSTKNSDIKCAIIERWNRTIKGKMYKYFTANGTRKYVDVLDKLVDAYNTTHHRSIKMKPAEVAYFNAPTVYHNLYHNKYQMRKNHHKAHPKINDTVRVKYDSKPFDKSFYPNWSDQVHTVEKVSRKSFKPVYTIRKEDGAIVDRKYYGDELQSINPSSYRIDKVLKTRIRDGKRQLLVRWLGYSKNYDSWIDEDQIVPIK